MAPSIGADWCLLLGLAAKAARWERRACPPRGPILQGGTSHGGDCIPGVVKGAPIAHAYTLLPPEMGLIHAAAPLFPRSVPAPEQRLARHALVPRDDHADDVGAPEAGCLV